MKNILITGAFGFIGLHLLAELKKYKYNLFTFSRSKKKLANHFSGNLLDENNFDEILNHIKPQIIIHLAWETTPSRFYNHKSNIKWSSATINLIEKFFLQGGEKFIFSSTCDEYEIKANEKNINELNTCKPKTLYGKSKNLVSNFLEKNFKNKSLILRNFFVCGPGENKNKLLSSIILNLNNDISINLRRPNDLIDFIDVRDVAKIISQFAVDKNYGIFNIGSATSNTPLNLTKKIIKIKGKFDNKDIINNTKQAEVIRIISDNSKLKNTLKYEIKFNINKTISDLIKIYDV